MVLSARSLLVYLQAMFIGAGAEDGFPPLQSVVAFEYIG